MGLTGQRSLSITSAYAGVLALEVEDHINVAITIHVFKSPVDRLGFTMQRPRRQARKANPLQQEAFIKKTSTNG